MWKLYHLYDLNLSRDLTFDLMHMVGLNLFEKYIKTLFEEITNDDTIKRVVEDISKIVAKERLQKGQWPKNPIEVHTSYMFEENQQFVLWILPHILNVVKCRISKSTLKSGLILTDVAHYMFNYTRSYGCTERSLKNVESLLGAWRILQEESNRANGSPLEHVIGNK
jgi:hypothetical protein